MPLRHVPRLRGTASRLRFSVLVACTIVWAEVATAQPAAPAFDVASIRINNSDVLWPSGRVQSLPGGRAVATAIPVRELVRIAFGLGRWQEIRGPALLDRLVDLQAQAPQGYHTVAALESALPLLLRTLLIQRLQLSAREEIREAPVYELTLANSDGRLGPNMFREETADCSGARAAALGGVLPVGGDEVRVD